MSHTHLSARERCVILTLSQFGLNQAEIARRLCRHRSTISREIKRNQSPFWPHYSDRYAQYEAERRRRTARHRRRRDHRPLVDFVDAKLRAFWPPEAIAGRLIARFPGSSAMRISTEQIYAWIETDARTHGTLYRHLRQQHKTRRRRRSRGANRARREARLDIMQRPAIVDRRARFGDWEGDTVMGSGQAAFVTHVERRSGYIVAFKQPSRSSVPLAEATIKAFQRVPRRWKQTLTYDNGTEFSAYDRIENGTGFRVFFARPHSPWQRGCNENANGLLRQFFPKRRSLDPVHQSELDKAVELLNHRPRKRLSYRTPHEVLTQNGRVAIGT